MTIFSTPRLQREDMDVSEFGGGLGSTIAAAASEAVEEMPTVQLFGMREINEAQALDRGLDLGSAIERVQQGADPADVMYGAPIRKRPEMLPMEARERVKEAGLEKQVTIPDGGMIEPSALDIMIERGRHRQERAATIARGPQGVVSTALSVGTSFLVGAVDPVNVAAAFIPVVGELRYAKMLEAAGESALQRGIVRAEVGAASGAVGMAAIEPIAAFAKTQEGQDYTMTHALRSVIFGAALGGILHTGGGAIADIMRRRGERPLYPFDAGEPLEFHTPFDELRMPPAGSNLPGLEGLAPVRLPDTFEEAARRADNAGRPEPRPAEPAAARAADTGLGPAEGPQGAAPGEGGARAASPGEAGPERLTPSPIVAMIDDLPPRAREDAMRAATAAIIDGRPVQSGDIIAAGARADPRIAESVAEGNAHAIAQAAELTPHGRIVFDDMRGQLKRAGMSDEEAAANAAIVAARYEARAGRLEGAGGTAEDLYRAEGIRVQRGGVEDELGRTFAQRRQRGLEGQQDMFGGARATDADMAQRGADAPLRPDVAQKPMDEGLFGDTAAQTDLVDQARQKGQRELFQAPATVPTFFSAVSRAIGSARQEKASPEQWLATLRNTPGVKQEELQWLGLPDWLKEQKGSVSRKDIQEYVRANNIEVREVEKGGPVTATPQEQAALTAHLEVLERRGEIVDPMGEAQSTASELMDGALDRDATAIGNLEILGVPDRLISPFRDRGSGPTEYARFVLQGGENYRELLLTLPSETERALTAKGIAPEVARDAAGPVDQTFRSRHFDEPNIISHIRFNDRTIDGKKTLFIEEIQSDWHQAGKRKGYKGGDLDQRFDALNREYDEQGAIINSLGDKPTGELSEHELKVLDDASARRHELVDQMNEIHDTRRTGVPDAPFKTTWPELAFKRMIRYAAENGYDKIAWTPGKVQAERYDLSKHISSIDVMRDAHGNYEVRAHGREGHDLIDDVFPPEKLPGVVGKDLAEKIVKETPDGGAQKNFSGLDLKVGGEGMTGFYDKILPTTVNKLVKKYGAKVEPAEIGYTEKGQQEYAGRIPNDDEIDAVWAAASQPPREQVMESPVTGQRQMFQLNRTAVTGPLDDVMHAMRVGGDSFKQAMRTHGTPELADIFGGELAAPSEAAKTSVHAIDVTPELRKAATEEGFPLFQREPGGEMRGRITLADNKAIIDLFRSSDHSTFMHETGHLWLDELARDAARENAPEGVRRDMETVLKWLGADRADAITTEQHEKWASAFEQYLASGKAPTEGLRAVFEQFKEWLTAIYRGVVGSGQPISDDIRGVMDRMIATPAQLEREAADRAATVHVGPKGAKGPSARDPATFSLLEFIASRGGIRNDDPLVNDMRVSFGRDNKFVPGFGQLIRKPRQLTTAERLGGRHAPMTLDQAREAAVEAGYLRDTGADTGGESTTTINTLLEAIDREASGNRVYREGHGPARERTFDPDEEMHRVESELNAAMAEVGMQPHEISGRLRERTIEIMHREGERDPLAAYERAVMEESYNGAEIGTNERIPDHIPGWDTVHDDAGAAPAPGGPVETVRGPEAAGTRQGSRGAGAGNRGPAEGGTGREADDTWRRLADAPRDYNEPDVIAASRRADSLPEPASIQPDKRLAAAQKADADSALMYEAQAEYLPADLKGKVEQDLRLLDQENLDTAEVVRRGAACLAAGVVGVAI